MKPQEQLENHYNPRLEKYTETHRILDWESREAQMARFRVLLSSVPLEGKSLLDVGCGCGDLLALLKEEGIRAEYTGVDILPGMIEKARDLHCSDCFLCGDIFENPGICRKSYDVVFTSGIFNLNLGNNQAFFHRALDVFTELAGSALVINLLDEASPDRDDRYFYFSPEKAAAEMALRGWKVSIVREYLDNDFTLVGRRA